MITWASSAWVNAICGLDFASSAFRSATKEASPYTATSDVPARLARLPVSTTNLGRGAFRHETDATAAAPTPSLIAQLELMRRLTACCSAASAAERSESGVRCSDVLGARVVGLVAMGLLPPYARDGGSSRCQGVHRAGGAGRARREKTAGWRGLPA